MPDSHQLTRETLQPTTGAPLRVGVLVIGAGAVGLACALRLQADGADVAVLDKAGPARARRSAMRAISRRN